MTASRMSHPPRARRLFGAGLLDGQSVHALVNRPQPRRGQLEEVPVRITEVDAVPAARPTGAAFDSHPFLGEPLLPLRQCVGGNGKGHVQRSMAVVRRDRAARHAHGFERRAAVKQQQHTLTADIIGAKARVAGQRIKPQHLLVETRRTVEVIDVETGLDHALEPQLFHHILSTARASSDMRLGSQGGSHTMLTLTSPTPGTLATAFSTMVGSSCAEGQLGVVSVISTVTARSSAMSIL